MNEDSPAGNHHPLHKVLVGRICCKRDTNPKNKLSELPTPSGAEDVMEFERLVDLGEPFGAIGCAAAAAFIERQFQLAQ